MCGHVDGQNIIRKTGHTAAVGHDGRVRLVELEALILYQDIRFLAALLHIPKAVAVRLSNRFFREMSLFIRIAPKLVLGIKKKILLDLVQEAATKPIAGCTRRWWLPWVQVQLIERYGIDWDYGYINNNWNWIVELCLKVAYKKKLL